MNIPICKICKIQLYKKKSNNDHPLCFLNKLITNSTYDYHKMKGFKGKEYYYDGWNDEDNNIYHISCYEANIQTIILKN
jgi:hypothetical protein